MNLRDALAGVAGYSHSLGKSQPAQKHLWSINSALPPESPLGYRLRVSGSGQSLPLIAWIALLDPDVTTTATDGLYLAYLFDHELQSVYLSMNQGATQHRQAAEAQGLLGRSAEKAAIAEIIAETNGIRQSLDGDLLSHLEATIDLKATRYLPEAYEAGNIAAVKYSMDDLPTNDVLADDLAAFAALYSRCVEIKDALAANGQLKTSSRSGPKRAETPSAVPEFKPKSAGDYLANVKAASQRRTRKHEELIKIFGQDVMSTGRTANTKVHPRDLVVTSGNAEWLVEAKTVGINAEPAVRDAIGQLFSYRHFYYRAKDAPDPRLLALFNAPIGEAFGALLSSLDIDYVCRDAGHWIGSTDGSSLVA